MATLELTNNLLAEIGGWAALKEARGLVARGRVSEARREGDVIRARVQGAEKVHEPQITLADRVAKIEVRCTCAEFRRAGRVCPHVLAAGLAVMGGSRSVVAAAVPGSGPSLGDRRLPTAPPLGTAAATTAGRRRQRFLLEEAPAGTPRVEITVLLPLQLREALGKDPVRIILEARRGEEAQALPFEVAMRGVEGGFAVDEYDDRLLGALESVAGGASGINAVPRGKISSFLRALDGHPRVWLGKKERIEVQASAERARIIFSRRDDGALEMEVAGAGPRAGSLREAQRRATEEAPEATELRRQLRSQMEFGNEGKGGWELDGRVLVETPLLPAGFSSGTRLIPVAQIPDFLSREFPALERACEIVFAPGFEEFRLEIGRPAFEARLEGALSGLTLELIARYEGEEFSLNGKTESGAYQRYFPAASGKAEPSHGVRRLPERQSGSGQESDPPGNRFWRRNVLAEREALAEVAAAGFSHVRSGAATFSLISENKVARFLANVLPRWRRAWTVTFGSRLESTMEQIDVAQPEFSLRSAPGNDWLSLDLKLAVNGKPVALDEAEIQRWLQTGQSHARSANKRVLLVPTEAWREMKEVLADCEVDQEPGRISLRRTFAPYLTGALAAQGFRAGENVAADVSAPDVKAALGEKLFGQLRPYQAQGVEWLAGLAQRNFHGLLADDMGLGKTLQALAFCAWLRGKGVSHRGLKRSEEGEAGATELRGQGRSQMESGNEGKGAEATAAALVVCPTSLVVNWLREAGRFVPGLRALDLTGADRAEKWARRGEFDLLVTSYAILRRDIELYRAEEFAVVILDEAQHIKNRGSQNAQSAKALRARHRLILTGTPLENSVLDLWSLYDFLLPGYLGTAADFKERYEAPLTKQPEPKLMERLRYRVRPFFLRRTKEEVLTELPPKLEFPTLCELSDEQREVYRAVLAQGRREVFEHSDKAGRKSGRDRLAVLTTLLRLRQVCCHLDLLPQGEGRSEKVGGRSGKAGEATELRGQVRSQMEFGIEGAEGAGRWKEPSAKMERTFELIDEAMDGGHRVLLFSQFVKVLHLLRAEAERRELRFCYLDGQTVERQAEVDRFQNDAGIPLFFISLKAGGTGLNLTGADTVIHFDPWWNPAVEEQATSRAHRMGQARRVSAYKLIAAGTVEEKIQALQARKRELFEASLGGDAAFVEKLSGDEIEELLEG